MRKITAKKELSKSIKDKYDAVLRDSSIAREVKEGKLTEEEKKREIKAYAIKKTVQVGEKQRPKYKIEIVGINEIEGGVEVFARAWKDKKQIGFGVDGTVDIERFIIINPPVLVPDINGDIVVEQPANPDLEIEASVVRFREDPEEAILSSLEHTISVITKSNDSKIIAGKRGNTTSTFYPASGATSPIDGQFFIYNSSWDTLHDKTALVPGDGDNRSVTDSLNFPAFTRKRSSDYTIGRGIFLFDTAAIPDSDSITSATFSLYISQVRNNHTGGTPAVGIVQSNPASTSDIADEDVDQVGDAIDNPTEGATRVTFASMSTGVYTDWTLDATGRGWIDKAGITKLGTRTSWDMDDSIPANINTSGSGINSYFADQTGTSLDPKLVVEHSGGGGGVVAPQFIGFGGL